MGIAADRGLDSAAGARRRRNSGSRTYDRAMRTRIAATPAALAALAVGALVLAASGCKPMNPRPAQAKPAEEPTDVASKRDGSHPSPGDPEWESSSSLGKARDAAVRVKAKVDAYQQEVSRQADEVFKNP